MRHSIIPFSCVRGSSVLPLLTKGVLHISHRQPFVQGIEITPTTVGVSEYVYACDVRKREIGEVNRITTTK